jgi:hypothetical protein
MSQRADNPRSDLLWGDQEIADYINAKTRRQVAYLVETGKIRVTKAGPRTLFARRSEIDADLSALAETST